MTKEQTKKWILDQVNKDFEEVTEEYFESGAIRPTLDYYAELFEKYHKERLALFSVSGSAWDLPDGVYQVGVDKATKGSKDYSTRIWMKKGISGEMVILAEEHYR